MFKVGDVAIGNALAGKYGITNRNWIGTVTSIDNEDNMMWVKPYNGHDDDRYHVDMACFDLYQRTVDLPSEPVKVSKEKLLLALSTQNDCFYSLAQVIDMINSIEDPKPEPASPKKDGMYDINEDDYNNFLDEVRERLEGNFCGSGDNYIDNSTAEFSLNDNRIELDSVELDSDGVVDTAMECLENVLNQYVEVLEKSEALES